MSRTLEVVEARDPRTESIWRALELVAAPSYFLSWGWIENWLACVPRAHTPELAVISDDGVPIAACFLGLRSSVRHHVIPSTGLFVNATGLSDIDELCVEHNRLLCAPGTNVSFDDLAALLLPAEWDELILPAIDQMAVPNTPHGYRILVDREVPSPYVDLARVRAHPGGYLGLLGASTRAQIRRARRGVAELRVEIATELAQALEIYDELVRLHTASWRARREPGAFGDPWFDNFHRRLIEQRFHHGEIELVRVSAGMTIGCLYNFVANGRVSFYQSGLAHLEDPRIKPGYLCHAAAIEHAATAGHAVYDLLGGSAPYKRSLATDETLLVWIRIQRPRVRFAIEARIRSLVARM